MVSCILYSKFLHLVSCMLYSQYPHLTSDQVWLINEKILHRVNECERASWGDFFGHKCSNHNRTLGWFDLRQKGSNLSTCRRLRPCPTSRRGFDPMTHRVRTNAAHICSTWCFLIPLHILVCSMRLQCLQRMWSSKGRMRLIFEFRAISIRLWFNKGWIHSRFKNFQTEQSLHEFFELNCVTSLNYLYSLSFFSKFQDKDC